MKADSHRKDGGFFSRALITVCAVIFALMVSEGVLRVLERPVYYVAPGQTEGLFWESMIHQESLIPGLDYELRPGAKGALDGIPFLINSLGLRDEEMEIEKSPGQKRVAVMGDSLAFGFGVEARDTYTEVLEGFLRRDFPGGTHQVLNFGVSGYSSRDEALALKYKAAGFSPDLVIIGYCLNDPETAPIQPLHSFFHEHSWWRHSNLLSMLVWIRRQADIYLRADGNYIRYLYLEPRKWQSVLDAFEDIGGWSKENSVPVILLIFPAMVPPYSSWPDGYKYRDIHRKVSEAGAGAEFEVLDLYPVFSIYPAEQLVVSMEDAHPGRFGHQVVAREIHRAIRDRHADVFK